MLARGRLVVLRVAQAARNPEVIRQVVADVRVDRLAVDLLRQQEVARAAEEYRRILDVLAFFLEPVEAGDVVQGAEVARQLQFSGLLVGLAGFREAQEVVEKAVVVEAGFVLRMCGR